MNDLAQYIGYLASVFIVGGFVFKNIRTIRILNAIGCVCFVFFGFFASQNSIWPVIIPNAILTIIQIYYLISDKKAIK